MSPTPRTQNAKIITNNLRTFASFILLYVFSGVCSAGVCRREVTSRWLSRALKQTHNYSELSNRTCCTKMLEIFMLSGAQWRGQKFGLDWDFVYFVFEFSPTLGLVSQPVWDPDICHQATGREARRQQRYSKVEGQWMEVHACSVGWLNYANRCVCSWSTCWCSCR